MASTDDKSKQTRQHYLQNFMSALPDKLVQTFLLEKLNADRNWCDELMIYALPHTPADDLAEARYRQSISSMMRHHTNKSGYILPPAAEKLLDAINTLLDSTSKPSIAPQQAINLCIAALSQLPELGERMEDANERLYQLAEGICARLYECFIELDSTEQENLFQRLLREYAEPMYLDRDLDSIILKLLKQWTKYKPEWQKACLIQQETLLKQSQDDHWRKAYLIKQTSELLQGWHKE
ncbi:MAG: hypothetical protein CR991_05740 [Proteobacteria bacterium]|nr:MAG: hypothetical protein CR991_05740 [Pseudomonadota bacterium]